MAVTSLLGCCCAFVWTARAIGSRMSTDRGFKKYSSSLHQSLQQLRRMDRLAIHAEIEAFRRESSTVQFDQ
jgi:hypothetical protein